MPKKIIIKIIFCIPAFLFFSFQNKTFSYTITDFGAKADGITVNTVSINKAIATCSQNGGGTVLVPAGNFISGTIILKSNVDFYLEAGATITGSKDTADYLIMDDALFHEGYNRFGLIYASNAKNIFISGKGNFNGNGTYFVNGLDKPHMGRDYDRKFTRQGAEFMKQGTRFEDGPVSYSFRPGLMATILNCENVQITGVNFKDLSYPEIG